MDYNTGLQEHYRTEKEYAKRILQSEKGSELRSTLFAEAYSAVGNILKKYDLGAGETYYTEVVAKIISRNIDQDASILDLGCASGNLLEAMAKRGYLRIRGIDTSPDLVDQANERLRLLLPHNCGTPVIATDVMNYAPNERFDFICMDNVIEHLHPDSLSDVLAKCHNLLKHEGKLLIFTPHFFSGPHDISKHFLPHGSKSEGLHLKEYTVTTLANQIKDAGFQHIEAFPFHPKLLKRINIIPCHSVYALKKATFLEQLCSHTFFKHLFKISPTTSRLFVALLFPNVLVAFKK